MDNGTDFSDDYTPDDCWEEPDDIPKESYERINKLWGVIIELRRIFRGDYGPYSINLRQKAEFQIEQARALGLQPYSDGYAEMERLEGIFRRENRKLAHPEDYHLG
jgi:hypothetical protein